MGVGVVLVVGSAGAAPTGTIGLAGVDVLVESEDAVAGGGFWPSGITMGVDFVSSPPLESLSESDFNCGGQSIDVGGQLSVLSDPDDGGAQPEPAPKSPAVVQSALARPAGAIQPISETATATMHIRTTLIS